MARWRAGRAGLDRTQGGASQTVSGWIYSGRWIRRAAGCGGLAALLLLAGCAGEPGPQAVSATESGVSYQYRGGDLIPPTTLADAHCGQRRKLANLIEVTQLDHFSQRADFECR